MLSSKSSRASLAIATGLAMAAATQVATPWKAGHEASPSEARAASRQPANQAPVQSARSADAVPGSRWWSNPASKRRWPGRSWSVKAGQRMAAKRRNVLRNRRAHR